VIAAFARLYLVLMLVPGKCARDSVNLRRMLLKASIQSLISTGIEVAEGQSGKPFLSARRIDLFDSHR